MNIDELMTNIENRNFDSMTQQEMLDYYQELLDANDELRVRLTDLQETNPKPSQEEFENVRENMETINSEIERVSDAIQKNAEIQNVEEDFNEINGNENQIKDLEEKLKACAERMQKAREEGNEQAYAEERSRYSYLAEEINKLRNQIEDQKEDLEDSEILDIDLNTKKENSKSIDDKIKELEEKLNENARKLEKAFRDNNLKDEDKRTEERRLRKERKELLDELMNLKNPRSNGMSNSSIGASSSIDNGNSSSSGNSGSSSDNSSGNENSNDNKNEEEKDLDDTEDIELEEKEEENKTARAQKIRKAALGVLGGAIGFGLSFALQPGTAGIVISVGRLVYSTAKKGIKVYIDKHKDDENNKIVKLVDKVKEKKKEFMEKHPKIASGVAKVNNFLKKPETQVFLNGMAIGYTVGKISQAVYKMHEASAMEKKDLNPEIDKTEPEITSNVPDVDTTPEPKPIVNTEIAQIDTKPTFDPTKPVDLSSINEGFVSSYDGNNPVSLITSAGKDAIFDKINVVDGETFVHFKQANGAGYAWFKADDVLNALGLDSVSELTGEIGGKTL